MSYSVEEITSFRDVVDHFENAGEDEAIILLVGTGGYHGNRWTLNDLERILKGEDDKWKGDYVFATVLILNPADVIVKWGEVKIKSLNEVEYLRKKVRETISLVLQQEG
jgi:hypothetical protein